MITPYEIPTSELPIDIDLSRNEGSPWFVESDPAIGNLDRLVNRYPRTDELRNAIAERHGIETDRVLVTAGGDDALFRCFLANPGSRVATTTPTFEMISRYGEQTGSAIEEIPWWDGPFPIEIFETTSPRSQVAVVVSPNNPTGQTIAAGDLHRLSGAFELVVLDCAYTDFAEKDLTPIALELDNVVVVRTMSKAFGLAGLRVGYLLGPPALIETVSAFGSPYPVSGISAHLAQQAMRSDPLPRRQFVERVRDEREQLADLINRLGATALASQANFVLASSVDPAWMTAATAALGIGVRSFPGREELADSVRITVPGDKSRFERLACTLETIMSPDCLLFDLDGVLADVSDSYRGAIIATAASYGVTVTHEDISRAKAQPNSNDDWAVTERLCREAGVSVDSTELTARFETVYQGTASRPGLKSYESPLVSADRLGHWASKHRLGVVTGRPRKDAVEFLERFDLAEYFGVIVTREDAPLKPDPGPVLAAMEALGSKHAWMLGDTRDDLMAARASAALPIAVVAPGQNRAWARKSLSTAAAILDSTDQLEELLDGTQR